MKLLRVKKKTHNNKKQKQNMNKAICVKSLLGNKATLLSKGRILDLNKSSFYSSF